ncbi:MAG: hypothetical protein KDA29_02760 [Phycisphaerales bacterium]|nr:hypothetical protein [Phycisphaerales bacterium]
MTKPTHQPICPKCGYDQSGEIATWEFQCAVQGTCPECGFGFEWVDLLTPGRVRLSWYVEHASSLWSSLLKWPGTLSYLLFPNRYWRRLTMVAPRSMARWLLSFTTLMLIFHLITSVTLALSLHGSVVQSNASMRAIIPALSPQQQAQAQQYIIPDSGFDYWFRVSGESLLAPVVNRSFYSSDFAELGGGVAVFCSGVSLMWIIMFGCFPTTRKRAKLRMIHVVRAAIVCSTIPFLAFEIGRVCDGLVYAGDYWSPLRNIEQYLSPLALSVVAIVIWVQWFWVSAVRIGWRVRANWAELALVCFASFFGIVFAGVGMLISQSISGMLDLFASQLGI